MPEIEQKVILTLETGESQITLGGLKDKVSDLKKSLESLEVGSEEYKGTLKELQIYQNAVKDAMYGTSASIDDVEKSANGLSDSYNSLVHRMAALKNEFRATNDAARRADLGAQIKGINEQLKAMDALQGNFQRNVGNYTESVKEAFKGMKEGVDNFGKAAGIHLNGVKDSFEALSKTPLLAIVGLLVSAFTKLSERMKDDEEAMKGINAAVAVFKPLGQFLSSILEKISGWMADIIGKAGAFIGSNGIIQKVINGVVGVGNAIVQFIIAPFKGVAAAIKVFREEGIKGIGNAARAFDAEAKKGLSFRQNFNTGKTIVDTVIAGAKSKKPEVKEAGRETGKAFIDGVLEEIDRDIEAMAKEVSDNLAEAIADGLAADEKVQKNAAEAANRLLEGLDKYTDHRLALNDIETESEREKAANAYAIQKESNERRLALLRQFAQEATENGDLTAAFEYQQKAADLEVKIEENALREKKRLRELDKADRKQMLESTVTTVAGVLSSLASIYEADDKATAAQLKRAKAMKVASAIMTTLQGAVSAYVSGVESGIPAPGNIILGAAQAATVTAAGMANVAQIKRTNPGETGSAVVPAFQAPSIPTTMNTTRSITSASEEDRLNYMAHDQRVVLVTSDLEVKQGQRRVQLTESSF